MTAWYGASLYRFHCNLSCSIILPTLFLLEISLLRLHLLWKTPQPYTADAHSPHLGTDNVGGQISCQIEVTVYSGAFRGLILQVEFGYLFLIMIVNLIWTQMFLRKLRFATRYQYISMMLLQDDWLLRKWLYFIKIDPVQEFPGNNPPLYFYLFNNLVFRLNLCWAPDQEKMFYYLI